MEGNKKVIHSQELLKKKFRLPFQTTGFIYKALDLAEEQLIELMHENDKLEKENRELKIFKKSNLHKAISKNKTKLK